jgi:membrane-bound metal-dependent hydrolase YbcI (DUF457 family)
MRTFLGVTAATATIILVRLLPFLPGRYDSLAVHMSLSVQALSFVGLLLVPVGIAWLAFPLWKPNTGKHYPFAFIALIALWLVWLSVSLAALTSSVFLGVALLVLGAYVTRRAMPLVRDLKSGMSRRAPALPIYMAVVPIAVAILLWPLVPRVADLSRSRAIRNAEPLIAAIDRYRDLNGRYPASLLAAHMDHSPSLIGIDQYRYEPSGDAYNIVFEQLNNRFGTREFVVYNPRDEHVMTSHALDLLEFTGEDLARQRGYYAVQNGPHPRWKSFLFD